MSEKNHKSSSTNNNNKSCLKSFSLLDPHNFERLRYVVLPASIFILFVGGVLFLFVLNLSLRAVWETFLVIMAGEHPSDAVTMSLVVQFLEIISDILKAVIFFIIGVGIYSIFIAPLNIAHSLGITTFDDLEHRVLGIVVVVMSINFLEHFILWQRPAEMLQFAGALAVVAGALAVFMRFRSVTQQQTLHILPHDSRGDESKKHPENMQ